jgi:hypothetical protein
VQDMKETVEDVKRCLTAAITVARESRGRAPVTFSYHSSW